MKSWCQIPRIRPRIDSWYGHGGLQPNGHPLSNALSIVPHKLKSRRQPTSRPLINTHHSTWSAHLEASASITCRSAWKLQLDRMVVDRSAAVRMASSGNSVLQTIILSAIIVSVIEALAIIQWSGFRTGSASFSLQADQLLEIESPSRLARDPAGKVRIANIPGTSPLAGIRDCHAYLRRSVVNPSHVSSFTCIKCWCGEDALRDEITSLASVLS